MRRVCRYTVRPLPSQLRSKVDSIDAVGMSAGVGLERADESASSKLARNAAWFSNSVSRQAAAVQALLRCRGYRIHHGSHSTVKGTGYCRCFARPTQEKGV